jgi:hypothetical protein
MHAKTAALPPWYKQGWPWFLIGIPFSAICVGSFFIYQSIHGADPMVQEQYYAAGQSINKVIAAGKQAQSMGLSGALTVGSHQVSLVLQQKGTQPLPPVLTLQLSHPTIVSLDQTVNLVASQPGQYSGEIKPSTATRWDLTLAAPDNSWSLSGSWSREQGAGAAVVLTPTDVREAAN